MNRITTSKAKAINLTPTVCVSFLGALFLVCVVAYMYFLSMSVVHVVFRKEVNQQSRHLESQIASLEAKYIEAQHAVSERIASAESLTETNEKIFVTRAPETLVFSRSNNN
jgi:hypothetical protein